MTGGTTGIATTQLAEFVDLVERLRRLVPQFTEALSAAALELDQLRCEIAKRAPKRRTAHPGPFTHLGQIVRWLREGAGLTRSQLEAQTGISAPTIRNIEKNRHKLTATTLRKLLAHPAMAALPERARQAGLPLGLGRNRVGEK